MIRWPSQSQQAKAQGKSKVESILVKYVLNPVSYFITNYFLSSFMEFSMLPSGEYSGTTFYYVIVCNEEQDLIMEIFLQLHQRS